jgi:predicted metalloprotease with PDZ domain
MSRRAAFFDRGYWRDRLNGANTFFHYYTYGETVALALDLELRRDHDSSLDQLMRQMWLDFGKNEKPFGVDDLERTLGGLSSPDFARSFFERFVRGSLRPDWSQLLPVVGLELVAEHPDSGWIGSVALSQRADGLELNGPTRRGEPLYDAGLDRGDILIELDGKKVDTVERLDRILDRERLIGHSVDLVYKTRSGIKTGTIEIAPDPRRALVPVETTGKTLAREPREARAAWLASRVED